jgi:TonB family protein
VRPNRLIPAKARRRTGAHLAYNEKIAMATPQPSVIELWKRWEGQTVDGRFRLGSYLGGTERGAVFLTESSATESGKAAIKLFPSDAATRNRHIERWKRVAELDHPNIIRLYHWGPCQLGDTQLLYLVMDYAPEDLAQVVPHRPLSAQEGHDVLEPILDALAYLHGRGLAHGHLKPSNIMAVDEKLRVASDRIGFAGDMKATKASVYDPPQLISSGLSPQGDIWSLGVTLTEVLTQQLPKWSRAEQRPVLPEGLPAPFLEIVQNCLRFEPERRWTVGDIQRRLQGGISKPEAASPAPTLAEITEAPEVKSRTKYVVMGAVAAAVLIAVAVFPRKHPGQKSAPAAPQPATVATSEPKPSAGLTASGRQVPTRPAASAATTPTASAAAAPASASSGEVPATTPPGSAAAHPAGLGSGGSVVNQVIPDVPQSAKDTIQGTIRVVVRVSVDATGKVVGTTLDTPGPSKYFARLATEAAQKWTFNPDQVDGQPVASEWLLRFDFTAEETRASALRIAP